MWTRLALLCFFCLSALAMSTLKRATNPEITPGYYQGDMIVIFKNGVIQPSRHWPNATVYYKIDKIFDEKEAALIQEAMQGIQNVTCLRFQQADNQTKDFVLFSDDLNEKGCTSYVGYFGGNQTINLEKNGCFYLGTIQHELVHALGFHHQQSSHDRDQYVRILFENVEKGHELNFEIETGTNNFGVPYDYGSLMHYGRFYFSKNETYLPTIEALRPSEATGMGQREGLSQSDVKKINIMYNCSVPTDSEEFVELTEFIYKGNRSSVFAD